MMEENGGKGMASQGAVLGHLERVRGWGKLGSTGWRRNNAEETPRRKRRRKKRPNRK